MTVAAGAAGFVDRADYYRALGVARDKLCAITVGDAVKVVPVAAPDGPPLLKSVWLEVVSRAGDLLRAVSEEGGSFDFSVGNVVDVMPGTELKTRAHECLQCLGAGRQLDDGDKKLLSDVRGVGFHVVKVPADADGPAFAFTVGLHHRFGHPEVIVVTLDIDTAHSVLNRLGVAISDGAYPDLGQLLEGTTCELREPNGQAVRHNYLGYARWFYRSDDFPVQQLYWPDCEVAL